MRHSEIVKILVPLTDNPNAPNKNRETPIYWANCNGHTEIVKILSIAEGSQTGAGLIFASCCCVIPKENNTNFLLILFDSVTKQSLSTILL